MKKLTARYKKWLMYRSYKCANKKYAINKMKNTITNTRAIIQRMDQDTLQNKIAPMVVRYGYRKIPPSVFCLDKNPEEVLDFVYNNRVDFKNSIGSKFHNSKYFDSKRFAKSVSWIDFSEIDEISTSAALLLAAEFDRMRKISSMPMFCVQYEKWKPIVKKVLHDIGFLEILDVSTDYKVPKDDNILIMKFSTGVSADTEEAGNIMDEIQDMIGCLPEGFDISLVSAVGEAMSNVARHAYPDDHDFEFPTTKQWWMTGAADLNSRKFKIIILDQGVTIPVHLPLNWDEKYLMALLPFSDGVTDSSMICRATKVGRSGTGEKKHGLGFQDMKEAVEKSLSGRLRIFSRQGEYIYTKGVGDSERNFESSIGGTLIEWEIDTV